MTTNCVKVTLGDLIDIKCIDGNYQKGIILESKLGCPDNNIQFNIDLLFTADKKTINLDDIYIIDGNLTIDICKLYAFIEDTNDEIKEQTVDVSSVPHLPNAILSHLAFDSQTFNMKLFVADTIQVPKCIDEINQLCTILFSSVKSNVVFKYPIDHCWNVIYFLDEINKIIDNTEWESDLKRKLKVGLTTIHFYFEFYLFRMTLFVSELPLAGQIQLKHNIPYEFYGEIIYDKNNSIQSNQLIQISSNNATTSTCNDANITMVHRNSVYPKTNNNNIDQNVTNIQDMPFIVNNWKQYSVIKPNNNNTMINTQAHNLQLLYLITKQLKKTEISNQHKLGRYIPLEYLVRFLKLSIIHILPKLFSKNDASIVIPAINFILYVMSTNLHIFKIVQLSQKDNQPINANGIMKFNDEYRKYVGKMCLRSWSVL